MCMPASGYRMRRNAVSFKSVSLLLTCLSATRQTDVNRIGSEIYVWWEDSNLLILWYRQTHNTSYCKFALAAEKIRNKYVSSTAGKCTNDHLTWLAWFSVTCAFQLISCNIICHDCDASRITDVVFLSGISKVLCVCVYIGPKGQHHYWTTGWVSDTYSFAVRGEVQLSRALYCIWSCPYIWSNYSTIQAGIFGNRIIEEAVCMYVFMLFIPHHSVSKRAPNII